MDHTWWRDPSELDNEQKQVLALPLGVSHLVIGPAGSGKTNLLLLRAAYIYRSNIKHIAVITFGRVLREFLATGTGNYPFSGNQLTTYLAWGTALLKENGITFNSSGPFKEVRARLYAELKSLAAQRNADNVYDCLLIDEGQDYSADEMDVIRSFANHVFVVGDNKQRIYDKNGALDHLAPACTVSKLSSHYRNGLKICRVADGIRNLVSHQDGLEASANYVESKNPSSVVERRSLSITDQVNMAATDVATQLRAYPTDFIGILCPRREELDAVWTSLQKTPIAGECQLQRFSHGYEPFSSATRVIVTTIHGAKGLEFRATHLLAMDTLRKFPLQKNIAFTAVTRTKTSLTLYSENDFPSYLEKGLAALSQKPVTPPSLSELFKQ